MHTDHVETQAARAVMMVRPRAFGSNPETLGSNAFQAPAPAGAADLANAARGELDGLVTVLRASGVGVHVFDGRPENDAPDEIFPNNWVSFHGDGSVVLYPMMAPSRRLERRLDLLQRLDDALGHHVARLIDLTHHENAGHYLEGTGSLVLDRVNRIAYACLSPRTHLEPLGDFAQRLGYEIVAFAALDRDNRPIYHTNVLMSVGTGFAVVCPAAISDARKRDAVLARLRASGRDVIELGFDQLHAFAGNLVELATPDGPVIALSTRAVGALGDAQREALAAHARLVTAHIPTIETYGGGSVRCMVAELHLPS